MAGSVSSVPTTNTTINVDNLSLLTMEEVGPLSTARGDQCSTARVEEFSTTKVVEGFSIAREVVFTSTRLVGDTEG